VHFLPPPSSPAPAPPALPLPRRRRRLPPPPSQRQAGDRTRAEQALRGRAEQTAKGGPPLAGRAPCRLGPPPRRRGPWLQQQLRKAPSSSLPLRRRSSPRPPSPRCAPSRPPRTPPPRAWRRGAHRPRALPRRARADLARAGPGGVAGRPWQGGLGGSMAAMAGRPRHAPPSPCSPPMEVAMLAVMARLELGAAAPSESPGAVSAPASMAHAGRGAGRASPAPSAPPLRRAEEPLAAAAGRMRGGLAAAARQGARGEAESAKASLGGLRGAGPRAACARCGRGEQGGRRRTALREAAGALGPLRQERGSPTVRAPAVPRRKRGGGGLRGCPAPPPRQLEDHGRR